MWAHLKVRLAAVFLILPLLWGCSSVTFTPVEGAETFPAKPRNFEVRILPKGAAQNYQIIGMVSCQDSASSSIWNWWTDQQALIIGMKDDNLERLLKEVRKVGGDVLIDVRHDVRAGGSTGGVGVGVGTGSSGVGVGVGTTLMSGSPKIYVVSYGEVGVSLSGSD